MPFFFMLATDVAGEMEAFADTLRDCKICYKACVAAVEMLAVRMSFLLSSRLS
jgi:hypothetical protein